MRRTIMFMGLLVSSPLFAQTSLPDAAPVADTVDCAGLWQTVQAASDRGHQLASVKRWKEAAPLWGEASAGIQQIVAACPEQAKSAMQLDGLVTKGFQQAEAALSHQSSCEPNIDKGFTADLKVGAARRENREPKEMDGLLADAERAWGAAASACASPYKERVERSLKSARKSREENAELLTGGPGCDSAWKNATMITDIAKEAKKAKKWDDAATLYGKSHMAWERVAESCAGTRQTTAAQRIEDALVDGHNAEFCGPQWDDANEMVGQLNKAKASGAAFAERDLLMVKTEVVWREAVALCRGEPRSIAKANADSISRERGAPLPPTAMATHGKNRSGPTEVVTAQPAKATTSAPAALVQTVVTKIAAPVVTVAAAVKPAEPGVIVAGDTIFRGDFTTNPDNGTVSGVGNIEWKNGDVYRGPVVNGLRQGKGRFTWKNGQWYEGDWKAGVATGKGVVFFPNGNRYEGAVENGVPQGLGSMVFASGDRYTGNLKQGIFHGHGSYFWKSGSVYVGDWVLGQKHGIGRMTMPEGGGWEGEYQNDQETDKVVRFKSSSTS